MKRKTKATASGSSRRRSNRRLVDGGGCLLEHELRHTVFLRQEVRATPWIDHEEFDSVGRALVSAAAIFGGGSEDDAVGGGDGGAAVEWALERVEVWKLRTSCGASKSSLPQSVEATHALAQCLWTDRAATGGQVCCRPPEGGVASPSPLPPAAALPATALSHLYGMAVSRTVNGLTDTLQQSRTHASSVMHLGQLLGIPGWIVDVRHRATHNAMPSVPVLRSAAVTLLRYLNQVYWTPVRSNRQAAEKQVLRLIDAAAEAERERRRSAVTRPPRQPPPEDAGGSEGAASSRIEGEGTDDDHSGVPGLVNRSVLGTCYNHFAVLFDDKKGSKKAAAKEEAEPQSSPSDADPPAALSSAPTWSGIPLDVAFRAVRDRAVEFCRGAAASGPPPESARPDDAPVELAAYAAVSRALPGLARAAARRLREEADSERPPEAPGVAGPPPPLFAGPWIDYLLALSRDGGSDGDSSTRSRRETSMSQDAAAAAATTATVTVTTATSSAAALAAGRGMESGTATRTSAERGAGGEAGGALTLEEMEDLLSGTTGQDAERDSDEQSARDQDDDMGEAAVADVSSPASIAGSRGGGGGGGWALCETWEPCAIGACPADPRQRPSA